VGTSWLFVSIAGSLLFLWLVIAVFSSATSSTAFEAGGKEGFPAEGPELDQMFSAPINEDTSPPESPDEFGFSSSGYGDAAFDPVEGGSESRVGKRAQRNHHDPSSERTAKTTPTRKSRTAQVPDVDSSDPELIANNSSENEEDGIEDEDQLEQELKRSASGSGPTIVNSTNSNVSKENNNSIRTDEKVQSLESAPDKKSDANATTDDISHSDSEILAGMEIVSRDSERGIVGDDAAGSEVDENSVKTSNDALRRRKPPRD